jgi:hypothetical protein
MTARYRGYFARPSSTSDQGAFEPSSKAGESGERADLTYRLVSIDPVPAPAECVGSDWHIYRIVQGENGITGYRRGDVECIRVDVETIVAALNQRRQATKEKEHSKSSHRRAPVVAPPAAAK